MTRTRRFVTLVVACSLSGWIAAAQQQTPAGPAAPSAGATQSVAVDDGIPVTDAVVVSACGSCHVPDEKKRMTRISYRRATPENWELTIRGCRSTASA